MSELQQEPTALQGEGRWSLGDPIADDRAPDSPVGDRWSDRKFSARLVNPANRRKMTAIIVGTGLAGGAAAAAAAGCEAVVRLVFGPQALLGRRGQGQGRGRGGGGRGILGRRHPLGRQESQDPELRLHLGEGRDGA